MPVPEAAIRSYRRVTVALMAVTGLLLTPALGLKSIWLDEAIGINIARQAGLAAAYARYRAAEVQPPLNNVLLYLWTRITGTGEVATRIPYVVLSVAAVGLTIVLARRLTNHRTALIAGYVMAISPFLLLFGRMSLYYVPSLFLTLASALTLVVALERSAEGRPARLLWMLHAASVLGLLMTNYTAIAYVLVEALFGALVLAGKASLPGQVSTVDSLDRRRAWRPWLFSTLVPVVGFAAWVAVDVTRLVGRDFSPRPAELLGLLRLFLNTAYPVYAWAIGPTLLPWHPAALIAAIAMAVGFALGMVRLVKERRRYLFIGLGFLGSLAITVLAYQVYIEGRPFETIPTRAIMAYPFCLFTLALGLDRLPKVFLVAALAALTIGSGVGAFNYFTGHQFHNGIYTVPSREMTRAILDDAQPGDVVVAESDTMVPFYFSYVDDPPCLLPIAFSRRTSEGQALSALRDSPPRRIWMVSLGRDGTEGLLSGDVRRWTEANYDLEASRGYAPQDPTYTRIKQRLQGGKPYRFKATVQLYEAQSAKRRSMTPCDDMAPSR